MRAPGLDAPDVPLVQVARPPDEIGRVSGEMDHVLAGSTADLDDVAGAIGEISFQRRPERLVIAMKRRRVQPAIRLDPAAVPAKFDDIFSQLTSPEMNSRQNESQGQTPRRMH